MIDDLKLAARAMVRAKGLAAGAVLCLALGIGGTTIVYSVTAALVLHPVPTPDPTGLVMVAEVPPEKPGHDDAEMAPANDPGHQRASGPHHNPPPPPPPHPPPPPPPVFRGPRCESHGRRPAGA